MELSELIVLKLCLHDFLSDRSEQKNVIPNKVTADGLKIYTCLSYIGIFGQKYHIGSPSTAQSVIQRITVIWETGDANTDLKTTMSVY